MPARVSALDVAIQKGRLPYRDLRVLRGALGFKRIADFAAFTNMTRDEITYIESGTRRRGIPMAYELMLRGLVLERIGTSYSLSGLLRLAMTNRHTLPSIEDEEFEVGTVIGQALHELKV